jgi:hypothetical protein
MVDPMDLDVKDLEDDKLLVWIGQYIDADASDEDWLELLIAIRGLGYHVGYKHGKEDVESGYYGKREEFTAT